MELLEKRILKEGKVLPGDILKIDCFLNHQIDPKLIEEIGKEFYRLFKDDKPNKILTIEASGIAPSYECAKAFGSIPVVFAKKTEALNMDGNKYQAKEKSYTRNIEYTISVAKEFLNENDEVLIIDDFLANGEASHALIEICKQANAKVVGVGCVVSKTYQPGEQRIKELGYHLEVLARVQSLENGVVKFVR